MNKIYIRKRKLKDAKKAEEELISNSASEFKPAASIKRTRKRKLQRRLVEDIERDNYSPVANKSNATIANFNNNATANVENHDKSPKKSRTSSRSNADELSREDKKLQYYLQMIQRQENAEKKKQSRKEAKKNKIQTKKVEPIQISQKPDVENFEVSITLVKGSDPELDILESCFKQPKSLANSDFFPWRESSSDLHYFMKECKFEVNSCAQSEDHNESTVDRLRSPSQTLSKPNSSESPTEDLAVIDSLRISNLCDDDLFKWDKAATNVGELNPSAKQSPPCSSEMPSPQSLKEQYMKQILELTKSTQERFNEREAREKKMVDAKTFCDQGAQVNFPQAPVCTKPVPAQTQRKRHMPLIRLKNCKSQDQCSSHNRMEAGSIKLPQTPKPVFRIIRHRAKSVKDLKSPKLKRAPSSVASTVGSRKDIFNSPANKALHWNTDKVAVSLIL